MAKDKPKSKLSTEMMPIEQLKRDPNNARMHNDINLAAIEASLREFGQQKPIVVDKDNVVVAGNGTLTAAINMGWQFIEITRSQLTDDERKAYALADNRTAELAAWDLPVLKHQLDDLKAVGFDVGSVGFDADFLKDLEPGSGGDGPGAGSGSLAATFGVPPFSVLNAREGSWQDRKREWLNRGIRSEIGRDIKPTNTSENAPDYMAGRGNDAGGSIFDPVLCELMYTWFSAVGDRVVDPFAGGSVRGIVAGVLGRDYWGCELRGEQVKANKEQWAAMEQPAGFGNVAWHEGDSTHIQKHYGRRKPAQMLLTCPPYADLEVYSDLPADISNKSYGEFLVAYNKIIEGAVNLLADDCFAVFVVGEVRGKDGNYYNFVGDTIAACTNAGLNYYNEIVLVTAIGSLPVRTGRAFQSGRKVGKTHQNVLVFCKGDGKAAAKRLGHIAIDVEPADG